MIITLLPHQEKALEAALNTGVIQSVEEFVDTAIARLPQPTAVQSEGKTGQALIDVLAEVRGLLSDEDIDSLFGRNRMPSRRVELT